MRIVILDGDTLAEGPALSSRLLLLSQTLESRGHSVVSFHLEDMHISACVGCFDCWLKHPGICAIHDDADLLCRGLLAADLVLLASSIKMGYVTSTLKRALERLLPLMLPYLKLHRGESHHELRYREKMPRLGLFLRPAIDTDTEDLSILSTLLHRMSLNFQTSVVLQALFDDPLEEVADAISRL